MIKSVEFGNLISKFETAKSVAETWRLLLMLSRQRGFGYGVITELPGKHDSLYDMAFCAEAPDEWRRRYTQNAYHRRDPIVLHARIVDRSYTWAEAARDTRYSPAQKRLMDERAEFNVYGGFTTPVTFGRRTAIVSLCGEARVVADYDRAILYATSVCALARIYALARVFPDSREFHRLPRRERECLAWAACGNTDRDIARKLGLSEKTVSTYIQRSKTRYGVTTRIQAIICALKNAEFEI
ncbi:MAG: LuxR family transcriptional regulator [Alphaproteobacteria bacterium]|nr:LuxR family transcriptional regulator [Alphaproteobacteria bacterium]MBV9694602.1 LuxR family transcriptional regulator [Alphaproteobacteria bacterium]